MNWYYAEDGQQAGPVDDSRFEELVRSGKIRSETLVWHEGMADWVPHHEVTGGSSPTGYTPTSNADVTPEAVCAECGKIFPIDETIRYGNVRVCAGCKPVFLQKLAEGAPLNTGDMNYAGFWTRFAAVFLDGLILGAVNFAIGMIAGLTAAQAIGVEPQAALALQLVLMVIQLAIGISYEVVLIGKYGATLGKMACKIKVVTADGDRVSYPRAFGRYFAKMLSYMVCLIGFIIAGFDSQKRALHDYICNTRVVFK